VTTGAGGVLLASSELEKTILWITMSQTTDAASSQLMHLSMADIVVDLFSSELVTVRMTWIGPGRAYYARSTQYRQCEEELFNALLDGGFLERQAISGSLRRWESYCSCSISIAGANISSVKPTLPNPTAIPRFCTACSIPGRARYLSAVAPANATVEVPACCPPKRR